MSADHVNRHINNLFPDTTTISLEASPPRCGPSKLRTELVLHDKHDTKTTAPPRAPADGSTSPEQQPREPVPAEGLKRGVKSLSLWDEMMMGQANIPNEPSTAGDAPEPADTARQEEADDDSTPGNVVARTRALPQDSYNLVLQMLGAASRQQAQAKQRWPKFVAAMEDAGFAPTEGAGSAVNFHATDGSGSITFHKPHPDSTVFPVMLRTFGRRMATWFGWKPSDFSAI